jgi:predicted MFS family arabinose efflux permease
MKDEPYLSIDSKYKWVMLALIWLGYFAFGVIAYCIPPLITPIGQDLSLTYSQIGSILGAFILIYIPLSIPVGILIDRAGMRKAIIAAVALIPLSALLQSFATDFQTLFLAISIIGVGGPFLSVGSMKIVASWFRGKQRGLASGLSMTGVFIGSSMATAITNPIVMPLVGTWRSTLLLYALLGFLIAFTWLLLSRDAPQTQSRTIKTPLRETIGKLLREKSVWTIIIIAFSAAFLSGYGFVRWLPKLLELKGMSPSEAGFYASLPGWSGLIGSIIIPSLAKAGSRKPVLFITLLIQGICIYAAATTTNLPFTASLIFYGICYGASAPLLLVILMDLPQVGAIYVGVASGILFSIGAIGGFTGPLIVGFLTDSTGTIVTGMILLAVLVEAMLIPTLLMKEK